MRINGWKGERPRDPVRLKKEERETERKGEGQIMLPPLKKKEKPQLELHNGRRQAGPLAGVATGQIISTALSLSSFKPQENV